MIWKKVSKSKNKPPRKQLFIAWDADHNEASPVIWDPLERDYFDIGSLHQVTVVYWMRFPEGPKISKPKKLKPIKYFEF